MACHLPSVPPSFARLSTILSTPPIANPPTRQPANRRPETDDPPVPLHRFRIQPSIHRSPTAPRPRLS
ncbi:hypothetical protein CIB48_g5838 [Xylaria polymorpha]|nr:hypothetical protein CIB48_g5838 [Xylaria polymorpha]